MSRGMVETECTDERMGSVKTEYRQPLVYDGVPFLKEMMQKMV
jgi:hypothetical protein